MISGTRKDRKEPTPAADPVGAGLVPVQPEPAQAPAALLTPDQVTKLLEELHTIRSRLGWILFFIAAVIAVQLFSGLFRGLP